MKKDVYYELTNPQKSIWYTEQVYGETPMENVSGTLVIKEKIDIEKLKEAVAIFVKKNEGLHLQITMIDGEPKQYVKSYDNFTVNVAYVSNDTEFDKLEKELVSIPFTLCNSYLFKFAILLYPDGHGGLMVIVHHLIADAWACRSYC